jgi:hypothetical protein
VIDWVDGDQFTGLTIGSPIVVNTTLTIVTAISSATRLTTFATFGAPIFGASYSADKTVSAAITAFLDTYFIAIPPDSKSVYISGINDGQSWAPLDFARKEAFPDAVNGILADHEELWLFGSETTEVWRNSGNADFPLQRDPGAFIHQGCRAPFSAVSLANGVAWIGGDVRGGPIAWLAQGYQPTRVSTHAIEAAWGKYSSITDAIAYVYVEDGHQFWVISFPTANATWAYDATNGTWHERGWWNGAGFDRHRGATHGYIFGKHLVGDWQNGKIYQMSLTAYDDAGTAIHRLRTAPHLSNEEDWSYPSRFRLAMLAGLTPTLCWSDDLGKNYNAPRAGSARRISSTDDSATQLSEWRRLGRFRSRVFSVAIADAAQVAITGAYLDISGGNG